MTNSVYINGRRPSSVPTHHHRRPLIVGTAHSGPHWTNAVRILRSATQNAVVHAGWRRSITPTTSVPPSSTASASSTASLCTCWRWCSRSWFEPHSTITDHYRRRRKCRRNLFMESRDD